MLVRKIMCPKMHKNMLIRNETQQNFFTSHLNQNKASVNCCKVSDLKVRRKSNSIKKKVIYIYIF